MRTYYVCAERADYSNVNLRDFESILLFFSEEEIEELQAAIDERRRSRRLARDGEELGPVDQPVYSSNVGEEVLSEVHTLHSPGPTPM